MIYGRFSYLQSISHFFSLQTIEKEHAQEINKSAIISLAHIDFNLELDYPEYTGARLNKDLRENLISLRVSC